MKLTIDIPDDEAATITAIMERHRPSFGNVSPSWAIRQALSSYAYRHHVGTDFGDRLVREAGRGDSLPVKKRNI